MRQHCTNCKYAAWRLNDDGLPVMKSARCTYEIPILPICFENHRGVQPKRAVVTTHTREGCVCWEFKEIIFAEK